jgi:hypothetical protein
VKDLQRGLVLHARERRVMAIEVGEHTRDVIPPVRKFDRPVLALGQTDRAAGRHPGAVAHRLRDDDLALRPDPDSRTPVDRDPVAGHIAPRWWHITTAV